MMKYRYLLPFALILLSSCTEKKQAPETVLETCMKQLIGWKTLQFATAMSNPYVSDKVEQTRYKLKKVAHEPHLNLFFYKEMNREIRVYYKLASLVVVEDVKKKISAFDYGNDRNIPDYLDAFMADDDNLLVLNKWLQTYKDTIQFAREESFRGINCFVYRFDKYTLWVDGETALPIKFEIDNGLPQPNEIVYENIVFDQPLDDEAFTHPEEAGYVFSVFGAPKESLLHTRAKDWTLLDLNGDAVSFSDYAGRPLFIEVWVSGCDHCIASIPAVKQVEQEFGDRVAVVTVNFDYDLPETQTTVQEQDIAYTVLQATARFDRDYNISSYPSTFVIDASGEIVYTATGALEGEKKDKLWDVLRQLAK